MLLSQLLPDDLELREEALRVGDELLVAVEVFDGDPKSLGHVGLRLKDPIGERSDKSNFRHQNSVNVLLEFDKLS